MKAGHKSECPVAAGQVADQNTESAVIVAPCDDEGKALATLKAAYALAGYAVHDLSCGGYLVARWNVTKHCPDRHALAGFSRQIGVRA
jgi:hypothetical protein